MEYYSQKLLEKLNMIDKYPLTVLEAPAGYGKTTAVHKALEHKTLDVPNTSIYWHTAVESLGDSSYEWFVERMEDIDVWTGRALRDLGYLNRSNADEAARLIREIKVNEPLTLVFDNFQYVVDNWQPQILDGIAKRADIKLRVIFVSQSFGRLRRLLTDLDKNINYIKPDDFLLSEKDIADFGRQCGKELTRSRIRNIHQKTGGWSAAVSAYLSEDADDNTRDEADLLCRSFWNHLETEQQNVLMRLTPFEKITKKLVENYDIEPLDNWEELVDLLRRVPLIRVREEENECYIHEIFGRFLESRLATQDEKYRDFVHSEAGRFFRDFGYTNAAINNFYKAKDWEGILSCNLTCLIMERFGDVSYKELAVKLLENCPEEIQRKYPVSVLKLCYALYAGCEFEEFEKHMKNVKIWLDEMGDEQLIGEWWLISAFIDFPGLKGMKARYEEAGKHMTEPSGIMVKEEPFMFGCTSMWYLFYSEPGKMMETADEFEETMKIYNSLTGNHGAGAAEIYRGEALSVQGRFEESDIMSYRAAMLAEQYNNVSAAYGAALLKGINAIYSEDLSGLGKAVDYLENKAQSFAYMKGKMLNTYMVDTVRGYLLGLMMQTSDSAVWAQGESDALADLTFTNFMVKTCRITDLMIKGEYKQAIASVEASLMLDRRLISVATRNFMYCGLALCYLAIGRPVQAAANLERSLELAGRDRNYTFIACFRKYFQILFIMPNISREYSEVIKQIKEVPVKYSRADETHMFDMLEAAAETTDTLTERERKVAELAAKGMRNNEIAQKLNVSENTVKHHLKSIFSKMNIDRRSKLVEMLK
ncbi:MAG: LuxR C-terminal-related transcriptional regulator [Lachnospiraceae bacterium]|nr:LuxR C-terminal-related transcriptional regulator [Lachnospiraceae bacterium]